MSDLAITNSTCLIALERIDRLDILKLSFAQIIIPPQVQVECGIQEKWLEVRPVKDNNLLRALCGRVDDGEAAAIALAAEMPNSVIILDDLKARICGEQMGLPVLGTVGLLLRAKRLGIITKVMPVIDDLIKVEFRLSKSLYEKAIQLSGEEK
ncbi:MAG: DUF3368 domain-containing protein [Candidatus Sumerlaeota bacterium]|nr:DUF3368 domain-containing protein [Candidatus Sumerlaeota bacterium]